VSSYSFVSQSRGMSQYKYVTRYRYLSHIGMCLNTGQCLNVGVCLNIFVPQTFVDLVKVKGKVHRCTGTVQAVRPAWGEEV